MKTGVDSVSKQVNARKSGVFLLGTIMTAVRRRYIAGNGSYICSHAKTDLPPQTVPGSTLKSAAGKTQCVPKLRPGVNWLCSIA